MLFCIKYFIFINQYSEFEFERPALFLLIPLWLCLFSHKMYFKSYILRTTLIMRWCSCDRPIPNCYYYDQSLATNCLYISCQFFTWHTTWLQIQILCTNNPEWSYLTYVSVSWKTIRVTFKTLFSYWQVRSCYFYILSHSVWFLVQLIIKIYLSITNEYHS